MSRLSFLLAGSAVATTSGAQKKMNVVSGLSALSEQMEGIKVLGNFLPPEQRPMISLLGKAVKASQQAEKTGATFTAMRALLCDSEIKDTVQNKVDAAVDFMTRAPEPEDEIAVSTGFTNATISLKRTEPESPAPGSFSVLSKAAVAQGTKYMMDNVICSQSFLEKQALLEQQIADGTYVKEVVEEQAEEEAAEVTETAEVATPTVAEVLEPAPAAAGKDNLMAKPRENAAKAQALMQLADRFLNKN